MSLTMNKDTFVTQDTLSDLLVAFARESVKCQATYRVGSMLAYDAAITWLIVAREDKNDRELLGEIDRMIADLRREQDLFQSQYSDVRVEYHTTVNVIISELRALEMHSLAA